MDADKGDRMHIDREAVSQWLERYVEAWRSYDERVIGDLFSEDAAYKYKPWDEPVKGREAIVANWLEDPDEAGSWTAQYQPFAVEGDRAVAVGWTSYFGPDGRTIELAYYNVWLLNFDNEGRCEDFTEVYMDAPTDRSA
jgi:ketosteroid isomerase-like protein